MNLMERHYTEHDRSPTALTIVSVAQYLHFKKIYSHGLGQLQHHLAQLSYGQYATKPEAMLLTAMVSIAQAMNLFLLQRYTMNQRLQGLGRVVKTHKSITLYTYPEKADWLHEATKDLQTACRDFSWTVSAICYFVEHAKEAYTAVIPAVSPQDFPQTATPVLRRYNSFSSIGSERPRMKLARLDQTGDSGTSLSTLGTEPSSERSSASLEVALSTGASSVDVDQFADLDDDEAEDVLHLFASSLVIED